MSNKNSLKDLALGFFAGTTLCLATYFLLPDKVIVVPEVNEQANLLWVDDRIGTSWADIEGSASELITDARYLQQQVDAHMEEYSSIYQNMLKN